MRLGRLTVGAALCLVAGCGVQPPEDMCAAHSQLEVPGFSIEDDLPEDAGYAPPSGIRTVTQVARLGDLTGDGIAEYGMLVRSYEGEIEAIVFRGGAPFPRVPAGELAAHDSVLGVYLPPDGFEIEFIEGPYDGNGDGRDDVGFYLASENLVANPDELVILEEPLEGRTVVSGDIPGALRVTDLDGAEVRGHAGVGDLDGDGKDELIVTRITGVPLDPPFDEPGESGGRMLGILRGGDYGQHYDVFQDERSFGVYGGLGNSIEFLGVVDLDGDSQEEILFTHRWDALARIGIIHGSVVTDWLGSPPASSPDRETLEALAGFSLISELGFELGSKGVVLSDGMEGDPSLLLRGIIDPGDPQYFLVLTELSLEQQHYTYDELLADQTITRIDPLAEEYIRGFTAGDFNGDGSRDTIIISPSRQVASCSEGLAYVFEDNTEPGSWDFLHAEAGSEGPLWKGPSETESGIEQAINLGDVTGDGVDDVGFLSVEWHVDEYDRHVFGSAWLFSGPTLWEP